jgi:mannose-6-phosphate isomerase-like protein (cupin superfamily)
VSSPDLPGAVGITALRVYDWDAADGLCGGSPHVHLCCTECYIVAGGSGRLQTLTASGAAEQPLHPGDVVWFTPGTVHRAVNDGDLQVIVLMQNSGLPEAGDAVLTFPPAHLVDREAYERAVAAPARVRRDLAVEGFLELRGRAEAGDTGALERFYAAAAALTRPQLAAWRERWRHGAAAAAARTGREIDALAAGDHSHLRAAAVARVEPPPQTTLGMCGYLAPYQAASAAPVVPPPAQQHDQRRQQPEQHH